jgi:hypothetical protein
VTADGCFAWNLKVDVPVAQGRAVLPFWRSSEEARVTRG